MFNQNHTAPGGARRHLPACGYGSHQRHRVDAQALANVALAASLSRRHPLDVVLGAAALAHLEIEGRLPDVAKLVGTTVRVSRGRYRGVRVPRRYTTAEVTALLRFEQKWGGPERTVARYATRAHADRVAAERMTAERGGGR